MNFKYLNITLVSNYIMLFFFLLFPFFPPHLSVTHDCHRKQISEVDLLTLAQVNHT